MSYFNYGGQSVIDTLKLLSINAGTYTKMFVSDANVCRKYNAGYKGKPSSKHRRKIICGLKKEEKGRGIFHEKCYPGMKKIAFFMFSL